MGTSKERLLGLVMYHMGKIIDGFMAGDKEKAIAYGRNLAVRLDEANEPAAAKRMRQLIGDEPRGPMYYLCKTTETTDAPAGGGAG